MTASLNPYISQFGEEFDAEKSSRYRMAIQCALGGLSYALLDTETQSLVALECYQSELLADSNDMARTFERAMEAKRLNNKSFQAVTYLVDNRICTLVPEPLFNAADQAKYLDFTFPIPENYSITSEPIPLAHCCNVFAHSKALQDKVLSKWNNAQVTHSSSVFVKGAMQSDLETGIFVHVRNRDFDMMIKKSGNLLFFNNFKFNTKEDFAYFLLFAMEQNGFSGQDTPVTFSGLILPSSEIIDLCKRYLKVVRFVEKPKEFKDSKALDEVPFQYYFIHYQALK